MSDKGRKKVDDEHSRRPDPDPHELADQGSYQEVADPWGGQHTDYRIDAGLAVLRGFFGAIMMVLLEVKRGCLWLVRSAKSYRASSWETVNGSVESVTVSTDHAGISENIGTALADAHLCYSYTSHGEMYGGCFQRMFYDEQRAWDFADQLKGRQVAIRRHPRKPDVSVLRLQDQVGGGAL